MGAGQQDPPPPIARRLVGSARAVGEDLADGTGWRRVQVRAGRLLQALLEPKIEGGLGGRELLESVGQILTSHIGDEEVALRGLLQGPHLPSNARGVTAGGEVCLTRPSELHEKSAGGGGLSRQDGQRKECLVHDRSSSAFAAHSGWPSPASAACRYPRVWPHA